MTYRVQIADVVRDATREEVARIEADREAEVARVAAIEAAAAAKASARAKLKALGLTDNEIAALVG